MEALIKTFAIILVFAFATSLMTLWFNTFIMGQYFLHGSIFMNVLIGTGVPLFITLGTFQSIKWILKA
jgi:hypothetical protein